MQKVAGPLSFGPKSALVGRYARTVHADSTRFGNVLRAQSANCRETENERCNVIARARSRNPQRESVTYESEAREKLSPFSPQPSVLLAPPALTATLPVVGGENDARVQMALLAQRVLSQMRTSMDGRVVQMRVNLGAGRELDIRLSRDDTGQIHIRLSGAPHDAGLAAKFAASLEVHGIAPSSIAF